MKTQQKATLYALSAILLWSTVATAFKIALKNINFIHLLLYVTFISSILLFIILLIEKKTHLIFKSTYREIGISALLSLLNPFLYYLFVFKSYSVLEAQIAQPLNYTWPVMLVLLSVPILKQKLSLKSFLAIIISFVGVFLISSTGNLADYKIKEPLGMSLALGSSVIWALFWIYNTKDTRPETIKLFFNFLFGFIYTLIFCFIIKKPPAMPDLVNWIPIYYIAFFEMGFTFLLWLKAMQLTSTTAKIGNFVFLSPFLSLIFIHLILGEKIYFTTLIGLVLIVSGILFQQVNVSFNKSKYAKK
ncbi:MAG: DMT family transporter [Chlorobi bacterium]|nr:DMT family transporter [Chlorobiota bacterium]